MKILRHRPSKLPASELYQQIDYLPDENVLSVEIKKYACRYFFLVVVGHFVIVVFEKKKKCFRRTKAMGKCKKFDDNEKKNDRPTDRPSNQRIFHKNK